MTAATHSVLVSILRVVEQVQTAGCPDPVQMTKFMADYNKMTQVMQALRPQGPPGTACSDPASLIALNLLIDAGRGALPFNAAGLSAMAPIMENGKDVQPGADPMCSALMQAQRLAATRRRGKSVDTFFDSSAAWRARPRRGSRYSVINPRTGERIVINSVVPFGWRRPRRLRIMDPRTGEEVMPALPGARGELGPADAAPRRERHSSVGAAARPSMGSSRPSICSTASRPGRSATPSAGRRERKSLAGRAVRDGSCWALEPACGGHWDWPLSRQEKKDRVLMLSQLELLEEIEDLQSAACDY